MRFHLKRRRRRAQFWFERIGLMFGDSYGVMDMGLRWDVLRWDAFCLRLRLEGSVVDFISTLDLRDGT